MPIHRGNYQGLLCSIGIIAYSTAMRGPFGLNLKTPSRPSNEASNARRRTTSGNRNSRWKLTDILESWLEMGGPRNGAFDLKEDIQAIFKAFPNTQTLTVTGGKWRERVRWEANTYAEQKKKGPEAVKNMVPDFTIRWWKFKDDPKKEGFRKSICSPQWLTMCLQAHGAICRAF